MPEKTIISVKDKKKLSNVVASSNLLTPTGLCPISKDNLGFNA